MKQTHILIIIAVFVSIGIAFYQAHPVHCFEPTNIKITVIPPNIPHGQTGQVKVEITGKIAFPDQQAQYFHVRLVDEDVVADDILGDVKFESDPGDRWVMGQTRTFTHTFTIRNECGTIKGTESSGESEAELAVEIDTGALERKENFYDTAAGTTVPVRAEKKVGGIWVPIDKFGLLAPYISLASIVVTTVAAAIYVKRVKHRKEK